MKALFLDRDGIINIDTHYVHKIEDFVFIEEIFEICKYFQTNEYQIFIITNQAGIARNYYTKEDFFKLTNYMLDEFAKQDIIIQKVYFCPHHPTEGIGDYKISCNCRKPNPGMLLQAKDEFQIDLSSAILVGDKESDILAGMNVGVKQCIFINTKQPSIKGEFLHFQSHKEFLEYLLG